MQLREGLSLHVRFQVLDVYFVNRLAGTSGGC